MKYPFIAAMLSACAVASNAEPMDPLGGHRWNHRVLIAFANDSADSRAGTLRTSLAEASCELGDRDIVIGWILSEGASRVGEVAVSDEIAASLRSGLGIQPGEFAVLLIGKDGGVKARYGDVPALSAVFALIDGMPMRRSEMRSSPSGCSGQD
ncbi:MAG: DUF4174 domain-containing protein [Gammaproteobacteria bacterium]|nr:DUF4174 domain-containing protein [Gammaproteobacteria bacterium]MDH3507799.1 DUF4174 domain-containing protein [Gammaproteobacteria bacterium]